MFQDTQKFLDPDLRSLLNACHMREIFWMLEMVVHHGQFSQPDLKQSLASFLPTQIFPSTQETVSQNFHVSPLHWAKREIIEGKQQFILSTGLLIFLMLHSFYLTSLKDFTAFLQSSGDPIKSDSFSTAFF